MAGRACATALLCAYRAVPQNFDYVKSMGAMGGERSDGGAAWQPQNLPEWSFRGAAAGSAEGGGKRACLRGGRVSGKGRDRNTALFAGHWAFSSAMSFPGSARSTVPRSPLCRGFSPQTTLWIEPSACPSPLPGRVASSRRARSVGWRLGDPSERDEPAPPQPCLTASRSAPALR